MKKLTNISNQIKNNTFSYTGKGSFEAVVNKNKDTILEWLEDLIPLQKQIDMLKEMEYLDFQKRNYTRILTKIFPYEYTEFVSLNILVRDANIIAQYYDDEFNITLLYDNLLKDKYLKYPGKYEKYVGYNIFQKFVIMYRDDLMTSLNNDNKRTVSVTPIIKEEPKKIETETIEPENNSENTIEEPMPKETKKDTSKEKTKKMTKEEKKSSQAKDTNWTQLLLGKLK